MRQLRFAVAATIMAADGQSAYAAPPLTQPDATCRAHAPEAVVRSGLAIEVLLRIMTAESGGSASVVSTKGAMGCMQIMPATWAYLSRRNGLGNDPYDARMNMIGGALYLAELARRFGWPGAYAAYNAGPARYIRYAAGGVPLPTETVAYVARLGSAAAPANGAVPHVRWQDARLFLTRVGETGSTSQLPPIVLVAEAEGAIAAPALPAVTSAARLVPTLFPLSVSVTPVPR